MGMYKSPIEIFYGQMRTQLENDVIKAVQNVGVNVDQNELIRALKYDRDQYEKGYADGKADTMANLVRCKDCEKWYRHTQVDRERGECRRYETTKHENGYCDRGERKDND